MTEQIGFKFNHSAFTDADQVKVVRFTGNEGISQLFEFSIELKSINADLDIDAVLQSPASLEISLQDDHRKIQGIVSHFEAIRQVNNETIYNAVLRPRLWELSLFHTNEIYLGQTVPVIIETVLKEAGFSSLDYDISGLTGTYKKWLYKCQYGESHLDFISRLMERDGIYYYFTEGDTGEKVVFCDSLQLQEKIANPKVLYSPVASLEINTLNSNVQSFVSQQKRLPHKVLLKDYNDDKPSVDIKGEAIIDKAANASSEIYVWGQNIETPEEGKQLADIRAEEIRSGKKTYHGESTVMRLIPGFNFTLEGHFRQACNQDYLLVTINHEGVDPGTLELNGQSGGQINVYNNSFMSIPAEVQFRCEQLTHKPEIQGTLNAFIDADGDGQYAEVDEEGRYRVTLPFDRVLKDEGKASHWIRMSQPFGGENQGMHFPLQKGAAVLLTFIGGDPDRPVIAGSIPNSSQPSIVNAENQTNSMIKTGSGNKIELEDQEGKNRIKLETGDGKTYMHLGSPNHDGDGLVMLTKKLMRLEIGGGKQWAFVANDDFKEDEDYAEKKGGTGYKKGKSNVSNLIDEQKLFQFYKPKNEKFPKDNTASGSMSVQLEKTDEMSGKYLSTRHLGNHYQWHEGDNYIWGANSSDFVFGPGYSEMHVYDGIDGRPNPTIRNQLLPHDIFHSNKEYKAEDFTLDSGKALINKIIGDSYEYHYGNVYEVWNGNFEEKFEGNRRAKTTGHVFEEINGNVIEKTNGNVTEEIKGNITEKITGNTNTTLTGDVTSTITGDVKEEYKGTTKERFNGYLDSMMIAGSSEMQLGGASSLFLGAKNEMSLAIEYELTLGKKFGYNRQEDIEAKETKVEIVNAAVNKAKDEINKTNNIVSKLKSQMIASNLSIRKVKNDITQCKIDTTECKTALINAKLLSII